MVWSSLVLGAVLVLVDDHGIDVPVVHVEILAHL